jgi:DNA polymerase elongation subunit (family B)
MVLYFITHIEPLHPLKRREALIVVREQDRERGIYRSHNIVKEIPHIIVSRTKDNNDIEDFLARLEGDPQYAHIDFRKRRFSGRRSFIYAYCGKEDRRILPEDFICKSNAKDRKDPMGWNSPTRMLRWHYPPLTIVNSPADIPKMNGRRRYASIDDVVNETFAAIDIEVEGWETGNDAIFMVIYYSSRSKVVMHNLPFADLFFDEFALVPVQSQNAFGERLTQLIAEEDPLWIEGHNIMQYDSITLREQTQAYFPATNSYKPITKSSQGLPRIITKGRFTLDTYPYLQNYLRIFQDQKLDTLARFRKSINYQEQAELVRRARTGDVHAFYRLLAYAIADVRSTHSLAQQYRENLVLQSRLFRRDPDSNCTTSKLTVAEDHWNRRYFLRRGTFPFKQMEHKPVNLDQLKLKYMNTDWQSGFFEGVHMIYFMPFIRAFSPLFTADAEVLHAQMHRESRPEQRFGLAQTLNAYLSHIVCEYDRILQRDGMRLGERVCSLSQRQKAAFSSLRKWYSLPPHDPVDVINAFADTIQQLHCALGRYRIINYSPYFYFIDGNVDRERLEKNDFGLHLGTGPVLSLGRNVVIANPFQEEDQRRFVYQGISPSRGKKSMFEKCLMQELIRKIFAREPLKNVKRYLTQHIRHYLSGRLPVEAYLLETNAESYYRNEITRVLVQSGCERSVIEQWERQKRRVHAYPQPDVRRYLEDFLGCMDKQFCGPVIRELVDNILHPYPAKVQWGYDSGMELPLPLFHSPDLPRYREELRKHFKGFFAVLGYSLKKAL